MSADLQPYESEGMIMWGFPMLTPSFGTVDGRDISPREVKGRVAEL